MENHENPMKIMKFIKIIEIDYRITKNHENQKN